MNKRTPADANAFSVCRRGRSGSHAAAVTTKCHLRWNDNVYPPRNKNRLEFSWTRPFSSHSAAARNTAASTADA